MGNETPVVVLSNEAVLARDLASTKLIRPDLGELLSAIKPQTGEERAAMTVPISPGVSPDDRMLFEDPHDPAIRFYLPCYRVATVRSGAGEEFRVRFSKDAAGATLEIVLEPYAAEGVLQTAPEAQPLPHTVSAVLTFEPAELAGVRRELAFTEVQQVEGGTRIALTVTAATEISDLYWALTRPENRAALVVRRLIEVALPVTVTREKPDRIDVVAVPFEPVLADTDLRVVTARTRIPKFEPVRRPDPLRDPDPELIREAVSTPVSDAVTVSVRDAVATPVLARSRMLGLTGRLRDLIRIGRVTDGVQIDPRPATKPGTPPPTGPGGPVETVVLYRRTTRSLEVTPAPQPFVFSPELHAYVFAGVTASGDPGALVLDQLEFGGAFHSYYRSSARPEVAYYLPDAFKLARLPERPRAPFMSVQFDSTDGTVTGTSATVVLAAAAWVDPARLADASVRLAAKAGTPGASVELQPLVADNERLSLRLALPGGDAQQVPGAVIDLRTVLRVGFSVPLARFQRLFDALQGGGAAMLGGEVEVRLDHPDRPAEKVPFEARFDDLAGSPVDVAVAPRDADGFDAVLTNVAESPVRVDAVHASAAGLPVSVDGVPAEPLAPGASVSLHLAASERPTVTAELTVLPDKDAIWDAICDETTSFLQREISVRTPAVMFDAAQGIVAVTVEIGAPTGGLTTTVSLDPQNLQATATVPLPFGDVVLRREDAGGYRYRVTAVRGDRQSTSEWKTGTSAVLFVVTGDVA